MRFHGMAHPAQLDGAAVEGFLSCFAGERGVSASTHRQVLAALLYFYGKAIDVDLPWLNDIGRSRPTRRLPVVLMPDEVARIFTFLEGEHWLFAQLLYGTGLRISEGRGTEPARKGCRLCARYDHRARGQGRKGLTGDAAAVAGFFPP
jgi:site-specific recombinase XerD